MTFCQIWKWSCMLKKLWKPPSRITYQYLRNLQGKYLCRSFIIVKSFFFRYTVILFHSNLDEKVTNSEQKVTSNKQKLKSNDIKLTTKEQNLTSNEQKVTSNEQRAKSSASVLKKLFEHEEENYYKPVRVGNFWSNN